jgi:hypothetical protein
VTPTLSLVTAGPLGPGLGAPVAEVGVGDGAGVGEPDPGGDGDGCGAPGGTGGPVGVVDS